MQPREILIHIAELPNEEKSSQNEIQINLSVGDDETPNYPVKPTTM